MITASDQQKIATKRVFFFFQKKGAIYLLKRTKRSITAQCTTIVVKERSK